jgi:hypothetical protein
MQRLGLAILKKNPMCGKSKSRMKMGNLFVFPE